MACIALDIKFADKNVVEDLGVFIDCTFTGTNFVLRKSRNPQIKQFIVQEIYTGLSGTVDYSELPNILLRDVKRGFFARGTENCKFLANLNDKKLENLDNYGCPDVQGLVDEENWVCSYCPIRRKTTLHFTESIAKIV